MRAAAAAAAGYLIVFGAEDWGKERRGERRERGEEGEGRGGRGERRENGGRKRERRREVPPQNISGIQKKFKD